MHPSHTVIRQATQQDRLPLYRMLELYQYDLSHVWDQDLDAHGEYGYPLDRFWLEPECHPFVALVEGHYAGFALVDRSVKIGPSGYWMDQFFVLKKYRRCGLGRELAAQVFKALPDHWEVGQMTDNLPAQAFWRAVIGELTQGHYSEAVLTEGWWQGVVQRFESKR